MKIQIVRDTREKSNYWNFSQFSNIEVTSKKLDTGDYSILGYEDKITVERKQSTSEISINIWEKRFKNELERMKDFHTKVIVCDFPYSSILKFPRDSGIPEDRWGNLKTSAKTLENKFMLLESKYEIPIVFFDNKYKAQKFVYELFQDFLNEQKSY